MTSHPKPPCELIPNHACYSDLVPTSAPVPEASITGDQDHTKAVDGTPIPTEPIEHVKASSFATKQDYEYDSLGEGSGKAKTGMDSLSQKMGDSKEDDVETSKETEDLLQRTIANLQSKLSQGSTQEETGMPERRKQGGLLSSGTEQHQGSAIDSEGDLEPQQQKENSRSDQSDPNHERFQSPLVDSGESSETKDPFETTSKEDPDDAPFGSLYREPPVTTEKKSHLSSGLLQGVRDGSGKRPSSSRQFSNRGGVPRNWGSGNRQGIT